MAAAAAFALSGSATAAAAQNFTPIRVGQEVQGAIAATDPALSARGRFKVYRFDAAPGTRYLITMESSEFDPYVSVARVVGGITDVLKSDDDGGDGTNARLRWAAESGGSYLVIAQSFSTDGTGGFRLRVAPAPQPTTAAPRPIQLGQRISGELTETDALMDEDESFYDTYTLRARSGQRLTVEMASDSFDTYLHFGRMEAGQFVAIRSDDDGGEGTNSRLRVTVDQDGEYVIRTNALTAGGEGPYTLEVRERPAPQEPTPQPLRPGASISGQLDDSDAVLDEEEISYDLYSLSGRRGQRLEVTMQSSDFDTYLDLGRTRDGAWSSLRADDDGGEGTDSQLRVTLPEDGTYLLRARSFGEGGSGAYTLAVRELPPAPAVRRQPLRVGQTVRGELTEGDAVLEEEDIQYDLYTLRATTGQRLVIEMQSGDFDTYLEIGRMSGGTWESLRTDDDGGEGTHSRLRYTVTEAGEYLIRARSFGQGQTGAYTLTVTERATAGPPAPPQPIRAGEDVRGTLQDTDAELEDGSFYDVYTYAGRQGEELTITMRSEEFDTFLHFGRLRGGQFEDIATNDDGDDGTNSRLVVRLTEDGEYVIRANSLGGGVTGAYTLRVNSSRDR